MSILHRMPKQTIAESYTHKGWFLLCPIYIDMGPDVPQITERNWVPEIWLEIQAFAVQTVNMIGSAISDRYEPIQFSFWVEPLEG